MIQDHACDPALSSIVRFDRPVLRIAHPPFRGRADRAVDSRAIARVATPSAAIKKVRALNRVRYVIVERIKPSSSARSSLVNIGAAGATRTEPIFAKGFGSPIA
jgi:hypothetical protein